MGAWLRVGRLTDLSGLVALSNMHRFSLDRPTPVMKVEGISRVDGVQSLNFERQLMGNTLQVVE